MMAIGSAVQYTSLGEVNPIQRFFAQTRLPDRWYKSSLVEEELDGVSVHRQWACWKFNLEYSVCRHSAAVHGAA